MVKETTRYFTGMPCKKGHVAERLVSSRECIECKRLRELRRYQQVESLYRKLHYQDNREQKLQQQQVCDQKRKQEKLAYGKQWRANNKQYQQQYRHTNAGLFAFHTALRRKRVKLATPSWADFDIIRDLYIQAAREHKHVDHIIPIAGKNVCGLHISSNLQLLTEDENRRKRNTF